MTAQKSFYQVVTDAVAAITAQGYQSPEQIAEWTRLIREAAARSLTPTHVLEDALRSSLGSAYRRLIEREGILKFHQGVERFTLERVKPKLRLELDRQIVAAANLIKLNRASAIEKTLQRFAGWSTSIPPGGSKVVDKAGAKGNIRKALASLPFEERRVLIDQSAKFQNNLSHILAVDGGAIAAIWRHHHVTYPRPEHVARDGRLFLMRDSWAHKAGYVKPGANGYTDQIERPGEWVFCRCTYQWIYNLRDMPADVLTIKGREFLLTQPRRAA